MNDSTTRRPGPARHVGLDRRTVLAGAVALTALGACGGRASRPAAFERIEADSGGRIGVAALDVASGRVVSRRGEERFAMCSTFKLLLAGVVLQRVERGDEDLSRLVAFTREDLVVYSPLTGPGAQRGGMRVDELCSAAVSHSDNTAANLLLATLGGPPGFTAALRALGDTTTRLDRIEPGLNENRPGDPRDTSTPLAMLETTRRFLFSDALGASSRDLLRRWMSAAPTGRDRLRAGLPPGWIAGDKTGTSSNGQNNDVAFALPPAGVDAGPVLIVSFISAPEPFADATNALHARVAVHALRMLT